MHIIAAVNVGDSLQQAFNSFFGFLPNLLGFLIILVIGYIVARVVKGILTKVLDKVGLDRALHSGQTGQYVEKLSPNASPSRLVGSIAFWFLFLGAVSLAVSALKIPALTNFVATIYGYLPNVIAAVIIFALAGAIAAAVAGLVTKVMGDTPTGKPRRLGGADPDHGDRRVHDPQPARDCARDRDHHLCGAARVARTRHGAGLWARRSRDRRQARLRRL